MAIIDISSGDLNAALSRPSQTKPINKITQTEIITIIDPFKLLTHLKMKTTITILRFLSNTYSAGENLVAVIVQC